MADYKYAYNGPEEGTAKAMLRDAGVSTKVSIEISNYLRGKSTAKAKRILELVLEKKHAIPFKRFTDGVGHKTGNLDAGRYPQKASEAFLDLIKLAEANAAHKDLSEELEIVHLLAHKASTPFRYGRQRRRKMKRSHLEIVVKEKEGAKKKAPKSKPAEKKALAAGAEATSPAKEASKPVTPVKKAAEIKPVKKAAAKPVKKAAPAENKPTTSESKPNTEVSEK